MTPPDDEAATLIRVGQAAEMLGVSVETLRRWVQAGPHRLVSLMTSEAVDDLALEVGREAVCVVKSTNVIVEIPSGS